MKFLTYFTYRNVHGFERFPGDIAASVLFEVVLPGESLAPLITQHLNPNITVSIGVSQTGKTSDAFVEPEAKVNSQYW